MLFFCKVIGENNSWKWLVKRSPSKHECIRTFLCRKQYVYALISLKECFKTLNQRFRKQQVSQSQWVLFFERLHAQLAIGKSLQLALKQVGHASFWSLPIKQFIAQAIERLTEGYFISPLFNLKYLNLSPQQIGMLQCAESGGYFEQGLERLKEMMQFQLKIRKQMHQNLIYPTCVLGFAFIFGCVLSFFLLPRFEVFIEEQQIEINAFTQVLFTINHYALPLLILGLCSFVFIYLILKIKDISPWIYIERMLGHTCVSWKYSLFAMDLSHLLANQISLLESLKLASANLPKNFTFTAISSALNNGLTLSEALPQLPAEFRNALQSAELQGTLPQTLQQISLSYYQEYENQLMRYAKWLEPASLLLIALFLFTTILGLFYPLLHIFQTIHLE